MKKFLPLATVLVFSVSSVLAQTSTSSPAPGASPSPHKHKHLKKAVTATAMGSPGAAASASPKKHAWLKKMKAAAANAAASPAGDTSSAPTPSSNAKTADTTPATPAAGGGAGQVWVNTRTHVYHKEGTKYYGKTKQGKYMSEADAIKEGDHAEKGE